MIKKCLISAALVPLLANAAPFENCPSQAFLMQDSNAKMYGIDLASGRTNLIAGTLRLNGVEDNASVNAVGFNFKDQYLYGFRKESRQVVRIEQTIDGDSVHYDSTELNVSGLPENVHFFVGDVKVSGDTPAEGELDTRTSSYFIYNRGKGLFEVPLTDDLNAPLVAIKQSGSESWSTTIYDFAFHPITNKLYAMESDGDLFEISLEPNSTPELVTRLDIGSDSGAFGAAYFGVQDVYDEETGETKESIIFYVSNNASGNVFKVDLTNVPDDKSGYNPTTEIFTLGPKSGQNDGARCAIAKVEVTDESMDFGDAPLPYRSALDNNGARHVFDPNQDNENLIYLGNSVDGENINTSSDMTIDYSDSSDDGVILATDFAAGLTAQVIVTASQASTLYAWFDWNQDGNFSEDEKAIDKMSLSQGANSILIDVPESAANGNSWARFRVTDGQEVTLTAYGAVQGGEVEDYEFETFGSESYPGQNDWVTLAYEDRWPYLGDSDFNDLVLHYRTTKYFSSEGVTSYRIEGEILGVGASFHNGFAVRLFEKNNDSGLTHIINADQVDTQNATVLINGKTINQAVIEPNREQAIAVIASDIWDHVNIQNGCQYFRTEVNCDVNKKVTFSVNLPLVNAISPETAPGSLLDPFIFASEGHYHGDVITDGNYRGLEIHLKNQSPTEAFNLSLLDADADDASAPLESLYFQTENGIPFALAIGAPWRHPHEKVDINRAYSNFADFATSNGSTSPRWYNQVNTNMTIQVGAGQ
ncbi:LruC domain-containing protein [Pseudoalteromonas phenolica]|uniref:LruC domain-containing protein n=1 Tax=Pseudoalteromonas phenolica TaxID=161398 RepID=UPI00201664A0|nr:LruC domain-containing protein [Pseudoalteromonas phenolica]